MNFQGFQVLEIFIAPLFLLVILFPFILLFVITFKRNKGQHDKIIIGWLCVHGIKSLLVIIALVMQANVQRFLTDITKGLFMLDVFFFQALGKQVLHKDVKWEYNHLLTLIPAVTWLVTYVVIWITYDGSDVLSAYPLTTKIPVPFELLDIIVVSFVSTSGVIMLKRIKYIKRSRDKTIQIPQVDNFRNFIITLLSIFILILAWNLIIPKLSGQSQDLERLTAFLFFLMIVALVFLFGFFCIKQQKIFKENKSSIIASDKDLMGKLNHRIQQIMIADKPYLDPDFSMPKLAVLLEESPQKVSEAIKTTHRGSFLSYINQYRVEEVKKMIRNPEYGDYSLIAIGLESGFNSKATFYRVFKNETGMTPLDYKLKAKT